MKKILLSLVTVLFFATSFYTIEESNRLLEKSPLQNHLQKSIINSEPKSSAKYAEEIY